MPRGRTAFIRANLIPAPVADCPEIRLYSAHEGSGLSRLDSVAAPYWAWAWPGGIALARHVLAHRQVVAGARVLDLGAGSGLVAIAAALAGAAQVQAADTDPHARAAIRLNAQLNDVAITPLARDLLPGGLPDVDVILAGDVFYTPELAAETLAWLRRAHIAGIRVLLGDIGRKSLPLEGLAQVASYAVRDVGDTEKTPPRKGGVYELKAVGGISSPAV